MIRVRVALAALLAISAIGVLAVPASASTPTANTAKFCKAVSKIGDTTGTQPTGARAKALVKQFQTAANNAPSKVKSAIGKITKYLKVIAGGDIADLKDLATSGTYQGYASAIGTYTTYVATNCN
jgi:ABC-type Fe3+-hydroxamate transport system substrate-binding protein